MQVLSESEQKVYDSIFSQLAVDIVSEADYASLSQSSGVKDFVKMPQFQKVLVSSGLSKEQCSVIWTMTRTIMTKKNLQVLDRSTFFLALRLIAAVQDGKQPSPESVQGELPLPKVDLSQVLAVKTVLPPIPKSLQQKADGEVDIKQTNVTNTVETQKVNWSMAANEREWYVKQFQLQINMSKDPNSFFIEGAQAVEFLRSSKLPEVQLKQIWTLADADKDGKLSVMEFAIAMHIIRTIKHKNINVPTTLPTSLLSSVSSLKVRSNRASSVIADAADTVFPPSQRPLHTCVYTNPNDALQNTEMQALYAKGLALFNNDVETFLRAMKSHANTDESMKLCKLEQEKRRVSSEVAWDELHSNTKDVLFILDKSGSFVNEEDEEVEEEKQENGDEFTMDLPTTNENNDSSASLKIRRKTNVLEQKLGNAFHRMKGGVRKAVDRENYFKERIERNTENQRNVMQQTPPDHGLVIVNVIEGRGLGFSLIDGYCEIRMIMQDGKFEHNYYKTPTIPKNADPFWDEKCVLSWRSLYDAIVISVWNDKAKVIFVGRIVIPLSMIMQSLQNNQSFASWFPLLSRNGVINYSGSIFVEIMNQRVIKTPIPPVQSISLPVYEPKELSLFFGSWNVGNAPPPDDLTAWIPVGKHDLYIIGAQECKYSPRYDFNTCRDDWIASLIRCFGSGYTLVKYHSLWEMRLAVFVANDCKNRINSISFDNEATGIGNILGNKGGVVTSLEIDHITLCFVNCHLAAHQDKYDARNANIRQIMSNIHVGRCVDAFSGDLHTQFHHLFLLGDLNYRLSYAGQDKSPTLEMFSDMVNEISLEKANMKLLKTDQLVYAKQQQHALCDFNEDVITFRPTFKVQRREDGIQYTVKRSPAWCDRILCRTAPHISPPVQTSYGSAESIGSSDHKPVNASFLLKSMILKPAKNPSIGACIISFKSLIAQDLISLEERSSASNDKITDKNEATSNSQAALSMFSSFKNTIMQYKTSPYVRIRTSFMPDQQSKALPDTQNPRWSDYDMKDISMYYNNPERIKQCIIHIEVLTKTAINEAVLGYGSISLGDTNIVQLANENKGKNILCPLKCRLFYAGLPAGTFQCSAQFKWTFWKK